MLRVTVELIPHGDESKRETIGELEIWNTGFGTKEIGIYDAQISERCNLMGFKEDIEHTRGEGFWKLIVKALQSME